MNRRGVAIAIWLIAMLGAALVIARARFTADLSAFLPTAPTETQRLLVSQLLRGSGSRLILVGIDGADSATRALASSALANALRQHPQFKLVRNGSDPQNPADQAFVFANRYVLSDRIDGDYYSVDSLRSNVEDTLAQFSSSMGLMGKDLLARDPTGETLQIIAQYDSSRAPKLASGVWVSPDGQRALMILELAAAGIDTDAQEQAIAIVRTEFSAIARAAGGTSALALRISGTPVFSVESRETIKGEAERLSVISAVLIVAFLLFIYRSPLVLVLGLLPVVSAAAVGIAAVSLGFGVVHGVTLGFGATLIGEAVDYSIYLFIMGAGEARAGETWIRQYWPIVRVGLLTSVVGFACLLPSSFPGLAQLGVYTIAGLVTAGLVTRYILTAYVPRHLSFHVIDALGARFLAILARAQSVRRFVWLLPLAAFVALSVRHEDLWNRDLLSLSPISDSARAIDTELRSGLGVSDGATLVVVTAPSAEAALENSEQVGTYLDGLVSSGALAGYESAAKYLPSTATQARRRAAIPDEATLRRSFDQATGDLPLNRESFAGFFADVGAARSAAALSLEDIQPTSMGAAVRNLLMQSGDRWMALMALQSAGERPIPVADIAAEVPKLTRGHDVAIMAFNVRDATNGIYSAYLKESVQLATLGLAGIVVLLAVCLRSAGRVARVIVPVLLAIVTLLGVFAIVGHEMTIMNLIGLLLTFAIGSNYALFFERSSAADRVVLDSRATAGLVIANLATVIGFGVLAFSSVPVLRDTGSTVALGALMSLWFSALMGARVTRS